MAGLQGKTTYKSAPFLSDSDETKDVLQKKAIKRAINKVMNKMAS